MKSVLRRIGSYLASRIVETQSRAVPSNSELSQMQIEQANFQLLAKMHYAQTGQAESLSDLKFGCFSQNDEDAQLLYIFTLVGAKNQIAVEMCASDGIECLAANLIICQGWKALLVDGDRQAIERGRAFYAALKKTCLQQPVFAHNWIGRDNVNQIMEKHGFSGEVDLLSLDLDGNDYHIWEAIETINPRVVVVEYNSVWPVAGVAKTVPYDEQFKLEYDSEFSLHYCGASLGAFQKLAGKKGYRLVGIESRYGFNAYFMRKDVGADIFPQIDPEEAIEKNSHCMTHTKAFRSNSDEAFQKRLKEIQEMPWIDVD